MEHKNTQIRECFSNVHAVPSTRICLGEEGKYIAFAAPMCSVCQCIDLEIVSLLQNTHALFARCEAVKRTDLRERSLLFFFARLPSLYIYIRKY